MIASFYFIFCLFKFVCVEVSAVQLWASALYSSSPLVAAASII